MRFSVFSQCITAAILLLAVNSRTHADDPVRDYPVRPVPFTQVQATDAFWTQRMETNRAVTIPFALGKCEETGRIDNFKLAGGLIEGKHRGGYGFDDTDVYKILEGASYALMVKPDPKLDKYAEELISYIAAAQEDDGYLYTTMTNGALDIVRACKPNKQRWDSLHHSHELYNVGHMYEAAVAHHQATGRKSFLDVAVKSADLLCRTFGPEQGKLHEPPGHQEVEIGLVRLYRATGKKEYLDLAKYFLDLRGREIDGRRLWGEYCQDHKPIVEQDEAVGHAVRATYMYSSIADVAALTGDEDYLRAIDTLWNNVVGKKLYLTGGIGATGAGEAYGKNYELPNRTAYCETCAAIANVYWNHRLFLLTGEARYIDVMERTLYNGLISGVSLDGKSFFYPNPLESHGTHQRSPWFGCACCPGNITRFVASVPGYAYATTDEAIYVNLYLSSVAKIPMGDQTIVIEQKTDYPFDGKVELTVRADKPIGPVTLKLRIPGWARGQVVPSDLYTFLDADQYEPLEAGEDGYRTVTCPMTDGKTTISLDLPMPARRVIAHNAVEADRGRVAMQRGPIVYCLEWPDVPDGEVIALMLPDDAELTAKHHPDLLGGVTTILTTAIQLRKTENGEIQEKPVAVSAIPYCTWANRGRGEMAVWIPRDLSAATPLPASTIASTSTATASGGDVAALNDQHEPKSSGDHTYAFLHWWPRKGTTEWVAYQFDRPTKVSAVEVYWFDDTGRGECRLPDSWRLLAQFDGKWQEVTGASGYGVAGDKYNRTTFDPIVAEGLKIEVKLQDRWAGGIHEWRVFP